MARRQRHSDPVLVIGLGRFGISLATALMRNGHEVLGADSDMKIVQEVMGTLTHVVQIDSTNVEALMQIGADQFTRAVVGIGTNLEASILTVSSLSDLKVPTIWAKAISERHAAILRRMGATHVVHPEEDMGRRIARRVVSGAEDFFDFKDGFSMVQVVAPTLVVGRSVGEVGFRDNYGVAVVCIKPPNADFQMATNDQVINAGDTLIIAGQSAAAQDFAEL